MTQRDEIPRHTTPTWEMELLIAAATVFALLQLPGVLDDLFYTYFPRFSRPLAVMILVPYLYGKTTVYALIVTFILHLGARGYWVALVGLRSVYPDGVRWDRLRWGPNYRETLQARTPAAHELIERADNRASLIFAYGIGFALLTLMPLVLLFVVASLTWLFQLATGGYFTWQRVWMGLLLLSIAPFLLAIAFDRFFGKRLAHDGTLARGARGLFGNYLRFGMGSTSTYPMLMFISRAGQKRGSLMMTAALFTLIGVTVAQQMAREGDFDVGNYGALVLGEPGAARAVRSEYYANRRRGADVASAAPFIPAEVVAGDWLRLFVPYQPRRDSDGIVAACGAAPVLPDDENGDAARTNVLDCLAKMYALQIDGQPLPGIVFDAADDEASGLRGVLAMIPVQTLAPGRHVLTVHRARSQLSDADAPVPPPHRIVFWR